jgi:RNA polymerase sigma factor (sigma-70 family)
LTPERVPKEAPGKWPAVFGLGRAKSRARDEADVESEPDASAESPPGQLSDAATVASAQAGEPEAWGAIYDANYSAIYRYIRARIFDDSLAEDLAADVFLSALESIGRYRDRGRPPLAWLYGIARNVVAGHQRKLARAGGLASQRQESSPAPPHSAQSFEFATAAGDPAYLITHLDLQVAIQQLTESQRDAVILRHFVGLTTAEIAGVLGKDAAGIIPDDSAEGRPGDS